MKAREKRIEGRYSVREDGVVLSNGMALAAVGGTWVSIGGQRRKVAYLVARAFVANAEGREYVIHKNGNPKDNRAENLEWSDRKEEGRRRGPKERQMWFGQFSVDGELIARFRSVREAAEMSGVEARGIRSALQRKNGSSGGFRWMYL